jgi:hypothetical protein
MPVECERNSSAGKGCEVAIFCCLSFLLPRNAAACCCRLLLPLPEPVFLAAASAMAALATCHRQAGNLDTSASLFEQLYSINERQSEGPVNQSGVMLARTLADVLGEAER